MVDQKVLLLLVVVALVGIAYYVRIKPHRQAQSGAARTTENAAPQPKPPSNSARREQCEFDCVGIHSKCWVNCSPDEKCQRACEQPKVRCLARCP
jgi:hypothetical protein